MSPAIVSLRASHRILDLSDVHTAIHGEFAYPMVARGRLIAVLVLGPKNSGESYAPDESASIEVLAIWDDNEAFVARQMTNFDLEEK